tara:strand:+ start:600 stop:773 length:174 start_codon:yes stop_codon:yes gene_type:complete
LRKKRFLYNKQKDQVLKYNSFADEYEIIGCHKDFNLHSDWSDRYKDKLLFEYFMGKE